MGILFKSKRKYSVFGFRYVEFEVKVGYLWFLGNQRYRIEGGKLYRKELDRKFIISFKVYL